MMRTAPSSSGAQPNVAQITYDEAIAALKAMFGHVPQATLEAVLRAQKWNMERTVEALLELNGAEPPPSSQQPPPLPQPTMPGPSSSSSAGQQPRRRGKPVALPDDFLRVPGRQQHQHARSLSGEEQLRADEALAQQLQQQETAVAGVDARYQQHRRERAASLQHPPQAQAHARRPRMQSAPGYPPSAGAGGRAPSPGVEESLEKLGKAIGQAGANVKKRVGDLYARFLNAKGGRHQRMEDDEDSEVVVFGSNSVGSVPVPPPLPHQPTQPQGPAATAAAARPQHHQQEEEEEEELFSRVNSAGTGGGAAGGPQASSTTHRMV